MFKLIEESAGTGELSRYGAPQQRVSYRIKRFQGHLGEGGLPVPGLYRIEGRIAFEDACTGNVAGDCVTLKLDDGRSMDVTLAADGSFQTEGRHSRGCSCC
jgi:hypothetical protein